MSEPSGPLKDITVIEISNTNFAAQIAASMLCELGAKVIKIEPPGRGDPARWVTPYGTLIEDKGIPYFIENACKEIVYLDMDNDKEKIIDIIKKSDILIDGLKPGEMHTRGFGYLEIQKLNPRAIYLAISPYGHFTTYAEKNANIPDSDLTAQAYNGYPSLIGNPYLEDKEHEAPLRAGIWVATIMAGVVGAFAALVALYHREFTGRGQFIDIATHETLSLIHLVPYIVGFFFNKSRPKYGLLDYIIYPFGYYRTKDGYVAVATPTDADFRALLKVVKLWKIEPDWRYAIDRISDDIKRIKELDDLIRSKIKEYTTLELIKKLIKYNSLYRKFVIFRPLQRHIGNPVIVKLYTLREVVNESHWYIRQSLIKYNNIILPNSPFKLSKTPGMRIYKLDKK